MKFKERFREWLEAWKMKDVWWDYGFATFFLADRIYDMTRHWRQFHRLEIYGSAWVDFLMIFVCLTMYAKGTIIWIHLHRKMPKSN